MAKRTHLGRLLEFYSINQFQMRTGFKKSKNFADIINGSSLRRRLQRAKPRLSLGNRSDLLTSSTSTTTITKMALARSLDIQGCTIRLSVVQCSCLIGTFHGQTKGTNMVCG